MKKVLILGSSGMLGHVVYLFLKSLNKYNIVDLTFRTKLTKDSVALNVRNEKYFKEFIKKENPDIIINCIGVLINGSKSDISNAIYINSFLPHFISAIAREISSKLIHISTDCVFSGKLGGYNENDICDAQDIYGRSKALGEVVNNIDLTLRTSIIGFEIKQNGEGLIDWYMNQNESIYGYSKVFWGGVTTLELAKNIHYAIDRDLKGLIHVTNQESISKYDLINLFNKYFSENKRVILENSEINYDKSLKTKFDGFDIPSYECMIEELNEFFMKNISFYKSFNKYC